MIDEYGDSVSHDTKHDREKIVETIGLLNFFNRILNVKSKM